MAFLRRSGKHGAAPRPDLILLDLNLSRMDSREVPAEIEKDNALKPIPAVILTTSSADGLHANCYVTKPVTMVESLKAVTAIEDFWLTIVKLPAAPPG
jgi:two-component system response regulator